MLNFDNKKMLALWLRDNKENKHKINLIEYMQDRMCKYSGEKDTPAEQIKGMNRLLKDIINLPPEMFENRN